MLKKLMLLRKRKDAQAALDAVTAELEALDTREAEIAASIDEAETDEEKQVVADSVDEYEKEKAEAEAKKADLEEKLAGIDEELKELEENAPTAEDDAEQRSAAAPKRKEREGKKYMANDEIRTGKFFRGMDRAYVDDLMAREDVKTFLENVRAIGQQKRAVTGAELAIPDVVLPLLRAKIEGYSKLLKHVNRVAVKGEARIRIAGAVSEAVWTEACAKLNELSFGLNRIDLDGYKVGGYIDICTAILEDTDFNLADYILTGIGEAIGLALDKAILYGTDVKMPLGIVTRLAQSVKPRDYSAVAPEWVNLSTSNIKQVSADNLAPEAFYSEIMGFAAAAKGKYSATGSKFWAMSEATLLALKSALLTFNAAGALTADVSNVMPLIGGAIEVLDFIPDGDVVGGYGQLYVLVERHGIKLQQSDIPRWYEDETSFKGTARYDGQPAIAEGFVAFNVNGAAVTTSVSFPQDVANTVSP